MKRASVLLVFVLLLALSACSKTDSGDSVPANDAEQTGSFTSTNAFEPKLTLTEAQWNGRTQVQPEPTINTFEGITEGTVVYNDQYYGKIIVVSINDLNIELEIESGSFAERYGNGITSRIVEPMGTITILRGEEKVIFSPTFDAGVNLTIRYE